MWLLVSSITNLTLRCGKFCRHVLAKVPETKGLTLEEMDSVFGVEDVTAQHQARQDAILQRLGLSQSDQSEKKRSSDEEA